MVISNIIGGINVGIIGFGKMGEAIANGLLKAKKYKIFFAEIDEKRANEVIGKYPQIKWLTLEQLIDTSQVIILAVKPQDLSQLLDKIDKILKKEKLFVSICAGISTSYLAGQLSKARIVRVMPNMGAVVGNSYSAITPGIKATPNDVKLVKEMLATIGKVEVISEDLMDAVTALSGSGPAYVALFIEALIDAGIRIGLPRSITEKLIFQTVLGTIELIIKNQKTPYEIKAMVSSPGGTTISALHEFYEKGFPGIVISAVYKAFLRSKELSKTLS